LAFGHPILIHLSALFHFCLPSCNNLYFEKIQTTKWREKAGRKASASDGIRIRICILPFLLFISPPRLAPNFSISLTCKIVFSLLLVTLFVVGCVAYWGMPRA
jgi:hypothetical protein